MGFPMRETVRPALGRAALIGVMLGGGLLYAGISQAQDVGVQGAQLERSAELVAATGGPASSEHLAAFSKDRTAVEPREDDVTALPAAAPAAEPQTTAPVTPAAASDRPRVAAADTPDRPQMPR